MALLGGLLCLALLLFAVAPSMANALPPQQHGDGDQEIVMVEEIVRYTTLEGRNATAALITLDDDDGGETASSEAADDNEATLRVVDDLIVPVKKPTATATLPQTTQQQQQQQQIHLLTSAEEETLPTSASAVMSSEEDDTLAAVELQPKNRVAPIDMSDFVALIPSAQVKLIARNYYEHDAEVQRAYAFLASRDFAALRQRILAVPEVRELLAYLNSSGLNMLVFVESFVNLTLCSQQSLQTPATTQAAPTAAAAVAQPQLVLSTAAAAGGAATAAAAAAAPPTTNESRPPTAALLPGVDSEVTLGNEIVAVQQSTTMPSVIERTTAKLELSGLHGLVDGILEVLPQDQILSTFFDKLETCGEFAQLVENIGSPAFAKILSNMERSVPLRNLIYTLHNNGIYIARIVDSLKAYFFLGTF